MNAEEAADRAIEAWRKFNDSTEKLIHKRREVIVKYNKSMDELIEEIKKQ